MRSASRVVLLAAGVLCAPAPVNAAGAADSVRTAASPASPRAPQVPPLPPGVLPPGCEPAEVRERLTAATDAEVSRACGNISKPWAYRGRAGRRMTLRDFGRHKAGADWTRAVSGLLLRDATVDTAFRVPRILVPCEVATGLPIYLLRFNGPGRPTFAVVRFDLGVTLLFDAELPLGMIAMGERADSLWAAFAEVLDDDPLLRRARPVVPAGDSATRLEGDLLWAEQLPEVLQHVAPEYPELARRTSTEGTVYVEALAGDDGNVRDAVVLAGPPALRDASLDAVWRWKFKPALTGGKPVAVWLVVPVTFRLR